MITKVGLVAETLKLVDWVGALIRDAWGGQLLDMHLFVLLIESLDSSWLRPSIVMSWSIYKIESVHSFVMFYQYIFGGRNCMIGSDPPSMCFK